MPINRQEFGNLELITAEDDAKLIKEEMKEYNKEYNKNHKKEIDGYQKEYNKTHKEEMKEYNRTYERKTLILMDVINKKAQIWFGGQLAG